ncbi:hypothetical protein FRC01_003361, partial [Tulasnella sp. 417]
ALEWFESLEDDTQSDWKLLRRAILARYAEHGSDKSTDNFQSTPENQETEQGMSILVFTGKDKDECRQFVRTIRLWAKAEGKINDSSWMCEAAYPCFSGDALEWYASLSADVQNEWRLLERAILKDYPLPPTLAICPARIRIDDWFTTIPPSLSIQSIRSQADWLAQARERRRMYLEAHDPSIPCWLLVENGDELPQNALRTGFDKSGHLYSARVWQDEGLHLGKCGRHFNGAHIPWAGKTLKSVKPFEVLVGNPSDFQWISIPDKASDGKGIRHKPFYGVDAGSQTPYKASLVHRFRHELGWHPGKAHTGEECGYISFNDEMIGRVTIIVLAWAN